MGLPWVRLDSNIAHHDKINDLLDAEPTKGWRAAFVYVSALGYAGGHGTDGLIKFSALSSVRGTRAVAELLVRYDLWRPDPHGWRIPNWEKRQELSTTTARRSLAQSAGAQKANCKRWHGEACGCWEQAS
jgi:hypothetical protein